MNQAYLFNQGQDYMSYHLLGSRPAADPAGQTGFHFAVWAPSAQSVSVVGSFNDWDPLATPLQRLGKTGIWTGFSQNAACHDRYKYAVADKQGLVTLKADPYARHSETRPANASILYDPADYTWQDHVWMASRPDALAAAPLNIYEVHLGSWKRHADGSFVNYRDLGRELADYAAGMGYNAVELLPVMEHPLDESWGYQVTGYYSVTSRHGTPADFKYLVDCLHQQGIRVILDWVPAHFPRDAFGLARFDGTPLYEHADTRLGEQQQWGTYVFDFSKLEVRSFLISNAWFWLDEFHIDGLRIDAVSCMLFLNFGRSDYLPNQHGGVANLEAIRLLQELNGLIRKKKPHVLMIAEEATPWPGVTRPVAQDGLGFTHKWNMGWMHDTLDYMSRDYTYRRWHHNQLTFSLTYAFSEHFVLPLSHDEVVHGKKSLIDRMPGDYWQRFACLRVLFTYQMTHPGGKLQFMGGEFGQFLEWRYYEQLEWFLLAYESHRSLQGFVRELNHLYLDRPGLWADDDSWDGFAWLNADDAANSLYSYRRGRTDGQMLIVILNMTPAPLPAYTLTVPAAGCYELLLNSAEPRFGGSGYPAGSSLFETVRLQDINLQKSQPVEGWQNGPDQLLLDIPPLCGLILCRLTTAEYEKKRDMHGRKSYGAN
ncbi:MAG: 1,4-alpha-glucan branching protein GlgB [Ruminococcaceae bacterium]|nr:1,4-alpha-glucan branching protein GlgB [Oscillospiraceae bacterium]